MTHMDPLTITVSIDLYEQTLFHFKPFSLVTDLFFSFLSLITKLMKIILMRHDSLYGFVAIYTVEPLNKGHVGMRSFVHHREVPFIWRLKCNGIIGIGLSFIERFSLFGVSFIEGATVYYVLVPYNFVIGSIWELTCANVSDSFMTKMFSEEETQCMTRLYKLFYDQNDDF